MPRTTPRGHRPTILHLVYSVEHGGTERTLCRLVSRLAADGMRHVVCTQRAPGARAAELPASVDVVPLHAGARGRFAFVRLADVMRRCCADVIHARNWGTWTDAVLAHRLAPQTRVVLGFHGLQQAAQFSVERRWRSRLLGITAGTFTAVSHAARAQLVQSLGCRAERVHVLPNGVDLARYAPVDAARRREARASWGLPAGDFVIGNVGNFFTPIKGHAVLLDAVQPLAARDPRVKLLLVGDGPRQEAIREAAQRRGIGDRVIFTGRLEDVSSALAAIDLYVCPSLSEGMSNALLEALACGLACVATDVSDHRRMFGGIDLESVVPAGDTAALRGAVERMRDDPRRRAEVGAAARALVARDYDFADTVEAYRRFYDSLVCRIDDKSPECAGAYAPDGACVPSAIVS